MRNILLQCFIFIQIWLLQGADYVHVSVKVLNGDHFECTCQTYTIIEATLKTKSNVNLDSGWSGISCCYIRFISQMLPLSESSIYLNYAEQNVLKLQPKSGVEKYSVATNSDAEFVTIYNIKNSSKKVISCHSSLCQYQQQKSRLMKNVENCWFMSSSGNI